MRKTSLISTVLAIVALAGCANDSSTSGGNGSASDFNDTDIMFVQTMLPHSDQAVSMSDLLLDKRGVQPDVAALARQIRDNQKTEIDTMNGWFAAMGRPQVEEGPHHGGLEGMLDEGEMQQLDLADAREGQRLFLQGMIKHHTSAIELANTEVAGGQHPGVVDLAKHIATTQQQEVDVMTDLLTRI